MNEIINVDITRVAEEAEELARALSEMPAYRSIGYVLEVEDLARLALVRAIRAGPEVLYAELVGAVAPLPADDGLVGPAPAPATAAAARVTGVGRGEATQTSATPATRATTAVINTEEGKG